jgi:glyoxylase-like metal-dependent hydrolase (beta-lactamase superfamily II)
MQIAPSLHRIGNGSVNAYLVEEAGLVTIVDAGVSGYWSDLPGELAAMGRSIDDVRALVLTHGHSDHIGFAERARTERGIPVTIHKLDAALARGEVPNPAKGGGPIRPLPLLRFMLLGIRKGALRTKNLGAVGTFGDGATLDVPGAPRVVLVPGHTPGSAALVVEARSVVFVGDAFATVAVTNGATGPMIAPFSADPAQALASLDRLRGVDAALALPGHGQPWTGGLDEAVRRIQAAGPDAMGRPGSSAAT